MRKKIIFRVAAAFVALVLIVGVGAMWWVRSQVAGSLPQLDGQTKVKGISAPVTVERDGLGIPTIKAGSRLDLAFATGFLHAQDRFFQMDLLRRNSAGELAELVGPAVLDADRRVRVHQFRKRAEQVIASGDSTERALIESYTTGVNAGLQSLAKRPFEYLLLGLEPVDWRPEDSVLVMFSMYLDLQGGDYADEARLGLMHDVLPGPLFEFLAPRGTQWDAPIHGEALAVAAIPASDVVDTHDAERYSPKRFSPPGMLPQPDTFHPGSNNWAVAGPQTSDGRALLADDMHLGIRVPHVWYRASFVWPGEDQDKSEQRITGATLPGTPAMVVGSNGHIAWGFTNSEGDWVDVVIVEVDPNDKDSYLTPAGPRKFERTKEVIKVQGQPDESLEVVSTIWGPVIDRDQQNRPRALRWVAHDTEGVNLGLIKIESLHSLEAALDQANQSGSPAQNFVIADDQGRIAWTILGRIPRRVGFDGRLPSSWADGSHRWEGYLAPAEYPRVFNPEQGRIWTANARVVSGDQLAILGDGGYDLGARARQIRDDLLATEKATEADMLKVQLDDRALFLEPWRQLLLDTLTDESTEGKPRRAELRKFVEDWGGRAAPDSVGFRAVRKFRHFLIAQLSDVLVSPCKEFQPDFSIAKMDRTEGPVWQLVSQRPPHLLDPRYESWEALLLSTVDLVLADAQKQSPRLADYTWGRHNTSKIQHPLSLAVPSLARWLDMPAQPLAGDTENMPRIQGPAVGASQRMAVSPGREQDGYFHMPCGQSGNPLSPHYGDAHQAWATGQPTPFLPGKTVHTLELQPAG